MSAGDNALIAGFIIGGSAPKRILLRGLGPSLSQAGLQGVLENPTLELRDVNGALVYFDNDWRDTQENEITATGIPPRDPREAAIVATVSPGAYTAVLRGFADASGIGLVEVYDLTPDPTNRLLNLSTRGFVDAADRTMIAGYIFGHGDGGTVLARALGPSLASKGITNSLPDPALRLFAPTGDLIVYNDNWKDTQQSLIERAGVSPTDEHESALVLDLPAGAYTASVDSHGHSGIALVELYDNRSTATPADVSSFEEGLDGWTPKAVDVDQPPVDWSVTSSNERALFGTASLKVALNNLTDAGKVWVEKPFSVLPNRSYHVRVSYALCSHDYGGVNAWRLITGVRSQPAQTRDDLTFQKSTWNGAAVESGYLWVEQSYDFDVQSSSDGLLYVDVGVWGTFEIYRAYYVDNLRVELSPR